MWSGQGGRPGVIVKLGGFHDNVLTITSLSIYVFLYHLDRSNLELSVGQCYSGESMRPTDPLV